MSDEDNEYQEEILGEHLWGDRGEDCSDIDFCSFKGMSCVAADQYPVKMSCHDKGNINGKGNPKGDSCE